MANTDRRGNLGRLLKRLNKVVRMVISALQNAVVDG